MWDTFLGVRNGKISFFLGQDRKSAFSGVAYFVRSRAWLSKAQSEPLISHFQVVKMTTWSAVQNEHLISSGSFRPLIVAKINGSK